MPRRKGRRCGLRRLTKLDIMIERNLTDGDAWGPWDIPTLRQFVQCWEQWKTPITERWTKSFPGSRPMGAYICGDITPWPALRDPPMSPLRPIEGFDGLIDTAGHKRMEEADHLFDLGVIDRKEYLAAKSRLRKEDGDCYTRYTRISAPSFSGPAEVTETVSDD